MHYLPRSYVSARIRSVYRHRVSWRPYVKRTHVRASFLEHTELIGRGLMLFVFFASTLNWLHYKELREAMEKDREDKDV